MQVRAPQDYLFEPGPEDGPCAAGPPAARGALVWLAMISLAEAVLVGAVIVTVALLVGHEPAPPADIVHEPPPVELPARDMAMAPAGPRPTQPPAAELPAAGDSSE